MKIFWLSTWTLVEREFIRFFRQRNRITGALATPIVFWLLLGFGFRSSFKMPGASGTDGITSLEYLYPGTIIMILLFTAIFSTISIIEDRKAGFLQSVLVAPLPRAAMVLGKLFGGTALATVQGLLFLILAPLMGLSFNPGTFLAATLMITLISFALTGLGFFIAWRMESIQGFHAIMNLFLMPLWFLSGSLFPIEGAPAGLKIAVMCNPLTYGVAALRRILYGFNTEIFSDLPPMGMSVLITIAFGLLTFGISIWIARSTSKGDLKS